MTAQSISELIDRLQKAAPFLGAISIGHSKQNHAGYRIIQAKHQFAVVTVLGQQYSPFTVCVFDDAQVGHPAIRSGDMDDIQLEPT